MYSVKMLNIKALEESFQCGATVPTFLKFLTFEGNAASALAVKQGLGFGKGHILNYLRNGVDAILSLLDDTTSHVVFLMISTRFV
jgi:hypothetical protein